MSNWLKIRLDEATVRRAQRAYCEAIIWGIPDEGLPEMVETLVRIWRFHRDRELAGPVAQEEMSR